MGAPKTTANGARRGRPPKFGRPGQVVALTLPPDVVRALRRVDTDLAWAIVTLVGKQPTEQLRSRPPDCELVRVGGRGSLIVVNRAVFKQLPGVQVIPLYGNRGFLALEEGRGMADLELAVIDRLASRSIDAEEAEALQGLRAQLRKWRLDPRLRCRTRTIIIVERAPGTAEPVRPSAAAV